MKNCTSFLYKKVILFALLFCLIQHSFSQTGTHLHFDGTNDYVAVTGATGIPIGNSNYTIEAWIKPSVIANNGIVGWGTYGNANQVNALRLDPTGKIVNYWWGSDLSVAYTFTPNTWYHVAATYNCTDRIIYVNGVVAGQDIPGVAHATSNANNFTIGSTNSAEYFNGGIDEVRIWNTALTATDIARRKNCELAGNETGLVAYYKFNQGTASGTNTGVTSLTDATANANNGTLTNFALTGSSSNWLSGSVVTSGVIVPTPPATALAQSFCSSSSPTVANLAPAPSTGIKWYSVATGGTALLSTAALATGTYYVDSVNTNGCVSARVQVAVTLNTPTVNTIANQTVCNNATTTAVNFSTPSTGGITTYSWTNNNTAIGLAATGTGSVPSFTATNITNAAITATITVTPTHSGTAYIANRASGTVSVINTATNALVTTVTVGGLPTGVSVSPDGARVYVTNSTSLGTVKVINTATNTVVATIAVGSSPNGISVSPDGSRVYVANNNSLGTVSVINTATNMVVATLAVDSYPEGISVSPDGSRVYLANYGSNNVSVINTATNTVLTNITVGTSPTGVSVSPDGSRVYVANLLSNNVSVINTATNAVEANIGVGTQPRGVSVSPDGSRVYVANSFSDDVSVINTATNAVVATVTVGTGPRGVSVSAWGNGVCG